MPLYSITAKAQGSRNGWQIANEKNQDPTQTRTTTPSSGGKQAPSDTTLQTEDLTEAFGTVCLCHPLKQAMASREQTIEDTATGTKQDVWNHLESQRGTVEQLPQDQKKEKNW
jgi:hypothetical protein